MAGTNKDWNNKVILAKAETTEGTDAAPTSALNALKVLNFGETFLTAEQKTRAYETAYFGATDFNLSNFTRSFTFDMLIHGGGVAAGTTVPPWMIPLQAAGFGTPVVGANMVTIAPTTSGIKSLTMWAYIDDLLTKLTGGRATVGFKIEDDEDPVWNFDLLGIPDTALASQAVPTSPTITGYIDPVLSSTENTTFTMGAFSPALRRWSMAANVDRQYRSLIGPPDRVNYVNRAWSGEVVIEVPDLTTKNYFSQIKPGTTMPASAVQGTTPGNIVQIDTPKLKISGAALSEEQGKAMCTLSVTALPNVGNDELLVTSK
jgi:hypothetical protein